ncbi:hypothetical protein [Photobacterium sp.]|uniref:hypothetical protein n=1 Tax=Photobacterium sp. TaxID=660 RepID=UPI00299F3F37|nr:hypothetical protein [Photobacterium sp.]MDX1301294.1 hypothetical protein [Photobacterium sp.]
MERATRYPNQPSAHTHYSPQQRYLIMSFSVIAAIVAGRLPKPLPIEIVWQWLTSFTNQSARYLQYETSGGVFDSTITTLKSMALGGSTEYYQY